MHRTWGLHGFHTPDYSARLERSAAHGRYLVPQARDTAGWDEPSPGLTAAVLGSNSVVRGSEADAALAALQPRGGLLYLASSRQGEAEFTASAHMGALVAVSAPRAWDLRATSGLQQRELRGQSATPLAAAVPAKAAASHAEPNKEHGVPLRQPARDCNLCASMVSLRVGALPLGPRFDAHAEWRSCCGSLVRGASHSPFEIPKLDLLRWLLPDPAARAAALQHGLIRRAPATTVDTAADLRSAWLCVSKCHEVVLARLRAARRATAWLVGWRIG